MLVSTLNLNEDHNKDSAYLNMYLSCDTSYNKKFIFIKSNIFKRRVNHLENEHLKLRENL